MKLALEQIKQIDDYLFEIPKGIKEFMRVPARFYYKKEDIPELFKDESLIQLINSTSIPGIVGYALAMPDMHEGYGVPVGCVFATKLDYGLISPGAIGFDINCGVRVLALPISYKEILPYIEKLTSEIFKEVPSGVGRGGRLKLSEDALNRVLKGGVPYLISKGYGIESDKNFIEENGLMENSDPSKVSNYAKKRGYDQLGTIGAGNHFIEIQKVEEIYDKDIPKDLGIEKDQITIMIHCGSRGLGHQVCTDYLKIMERAMKKYKINLPDRQLAGVPFNTKEGQDYFKAMCSAANFAFSNRQIITHWIREVIKRTLNINYEKIKIIYDITHNMAKIENYKVNGSNLKVLVHRKGATRAFPNQPVLIPGSMGTASYILIGQKKAMEESFGSSCHGAGRQMSRSRAIKEIRGDVLKKELEKKGIVVKAGSLRGLAEEAPRAYKTVDKVVEIVHKAGIAKKIARLIPIGVVKG